MLHAVDAAKYDPLNDTEQFYALHELSGSAIPDAIRELMQAEVRHHTVVNPDEMEQDVRDWLYSSHPSKNL